MWAWNGHKDYELLDCGDGEKLERWGNYFLRRPDPQAIWPKTLSEQEWSKADGVYARSATGGGEWTKKKLPEKWEISVGKLRFQVGPMNFKHTGLFPEQAENWAYCDNLIAHAKRPINVLNLFAYTGGASVACAKAGAAVCHVDASKGMTAWAKDNARLSGLADAPIRYIVDDCAKFVQREIRRGNRYEGIIMDPPSYGRGPSGEIWKLEENLFPFVELAAQVLSDEPLFFIINSYTTGLSASVLTYILASTVGKKYGGYTVSDELGLPVSCNGLVLPCGSTGRWTSDKK